MNINQKCINEIKSLSAQIVSNANSGHSGTAIGASSILYALFKDHLIFNPNDPKFLNRDRFILSAGHASALYYSLLHLFGFDISSDDLKNFRKTHSKTPGHPEVNITPGVEVSTGPLGQGIANTVGLAIAEANLEAKLKNCGSNLIDNYTYCFAGDGCLMEGVAMEACSLAGTLKLNKLILLYDDNNTTIDGTRILSNNENIEKKFKAMNWKVIKVRNGNDYLSCTKAIKSAKNSQKPVIIIFKTIIGLGTKLENTSKIHAYPMPKSEFEEFRNSLGVTNDFGFSDEVKSYCEAKLAKKLKVYFKWQENYKLLKINNKSAFNALKKATSDAKVNFENILSKLNLIDAKTGRDIASETLNLFAKECKNLIGGSADVASSTKAIITDGGDFSSDNKLGRNIHFGIREHAMGSICNGISLYNQSPSFNSTFLAFSNYMIPPLRMSSLMKTPVLSLFTHDSLNIGEDGPTHQPIEQLSMLRSIVGLTTFRPANKVETIAGFKYFYENKLPTAIVLSKTNLLSSENVKLEDAEKGAYIISKSSNEPDLLIFASGTEVELSINVANILKEKGISANVISVPSESIFAMQNKKYKSQVIAPNAKLKVAIEASNDNIWFKYVGENGLIFNVNQYYCSGKGSEIYKLAGFDADKIAKSIISKLK